MRLDKYLADMGTGSRSDLKKLIRSGAVSVNGTAVRDAGTQVTAVDDVKLNGAPVVWHKFEYYMMNKPAGVLSATEDPHQQTVTSLLPPGTRRDLAPVGRLDKDAEGLLILTNDGQLAHRLLSPAKHVPKTYYCELAKLVTAEDIRRFAEGLHVSEDPEAGTARGRESFNAAPAELKPVGKFAAQVTITEGRFHQVKRMFREVGNEVLYLKRISIGGLRLDPALEPGESRELTESEIDLLGGQS